LALAESTSLFAGGLIHSLSGHFSETMLIIASGVDTTWNQKYFMAMAMAMSEKNESYAFDLLESINRSLKFIVFSIKLSAVLSVLSVFFLLILIA
jgi:hypothetical protein